MRRPTKVAIFIPSAPRDHSSMEPRMQRRTLTLGGGIVLAAVALVGASQGRSDSRVNRLALRVDSLALTLTDVVTSVERAHPPPPPDTIEVEAIGLVRGRADAPVTMVEFLDYECPFCRRFHAETMPTLIAEYVESGELRIVLRDHPLPMHEQAMPAARAARCMAELDPGSFWQFSDALLAPDSQLDEARFRHLATRFGLDPQAFSTCASSDRHDESIQEDGEAARQAGLSGTPSFIIGPSEPDGFIRGRIIRGAYPIEAFRAAIDEALQGATGS